MIRKPYSVAAEHGDVVRVEVGVGADRPGAALVEELGRVGRVGVEPEGVADGEGVDGDAAEAGALPDADGVVEGDRVRRRGVRKVERFESPCEE